MWPQPRAGMLPHLLVVAVLLVAADNAGILDLTAQPRSPDRVVRSPSPRANATPSRAARSGIPRRYLALYRQAGQDEGVPWPLLAAVGKVESGHGRNMGPSSAGALGPMQFMPGTWRTWGRGGNVYDPADAIPAAARLLRALGINHRPSWALAAYNAGPGRADHPPAETRRYVANVRAIARRYQKGA